MNTMIIGIAGGTGSGKTTLTDHLAAHFGSAISVVHHDNYYKRQDVPFEERDEFRDACRAYHITQIYLVAPTSESRAADIARESEGFLYCVSSLGVTGVRAEIDDSIADIIRIARSVTDTSCAIGFGIATPEQAAHMAKYADGVIVGSAIVRIIAAHGRDSAGPVYDYMKSMKEAII